MVRVNVQCQFNILALDIELRKELVYLLAVWGCSGMVCICNNTRVKSLKNVNYLCLSVSENQMNLTDGQKIYNELTIISRKKEKRKE